MEKVEERKVCNKCKSDFPIDGFSPSKRNRGGRSPVCRKCAAARRKVRYARPKQEAKAKVCIKCGVMKEPSGFTKQQSSRDGLSRKCRSCRSSERAPEDVDKNKGRYLKWKFGITLEAFRDMVQKRGGLCEICRRPPGSKGLFVDHDHVTGEIRGLLCSQCNTAIGLLGDKSEVADSVSLYLRAAAEKKHLTELLERCEKVLHRERKHPDYSYAVVPVKGSTVIDWKWTEFGWEPNTEYDGHGVDECWRKRANHRDPRVSAQLHSPGEANAAVEAGGVRDQGPEADGQSGSQSS